MTDNDRPTVTGYDVAHAREWTPQYDCPTSHEYVPAFGGLSLVAKPCKKCGEFARNHPVAAAGGGS